MTQYLPNRQRLWHILYFSQLNQENKYGEQKLTLE
nr:MAG TPA: hypothetical protein [Caudoviricetes sp.]